jgi:hypothetical protein
MVFFERLCATLRTFKPAFEWLNVGDMIDFVERFNGAGEGIRTLDPNLGKVVLYP